MNKQPTTVIIMRKDDGRTLLLRKSDTKLFVLPGGRLNLDENPIDTIKREVFEETGIVLKDNGIRYLGNDVSFSGREVAVFIYDIPVSEIVVLSKEHDIYYFGFPDKMKPETFYGNTLSYINFDKHFDDVPLRSRLFTDEDDFRYHYRDVVGMNRSNPILSDFDLDCLRKLNVGEQVIPDSMEGFIKRIV